MSGGRCAASLASCTMLDARRTNHVNLINGTARIPVEEKGPALFGPGRFVPLQSCVCLGNQATVNCGLFVARVSLFSLILR